PENIFLCDDARGHLQPKLIDFGIAWSSERAQRATQSGMLLGTPHYMAPERFERGQSGPTGDIWAFTVVLYELVTGVKPFDGATLVALGSAVCAQAPVFVPDLIDPELWPIIERGLQKAPANRWPDFRSLGEALASWLLSLGVTEDITGAALTE